LPLYQSETPSLSVLAVQGALAPQPRALQPAAERGWLLVHEQGLDGAGGLRF
jgi:hypothetical protein